ncbi:hypothetical protein MTO96_039686 [Rhipicephalus appendiculatus]
MAQPTSNADSNENDDLRREMQDIKSQLQTLLHALNLGTDRDQDQRPEGGGRSAGGERMHQGPAEPPTSTVPDLDPVHVGDRDNATHPVALNDVLGVIVETKRQFAQALQQNGPSTSEDGPENQDIKPQQETRGVNNRYDNLNDGNSHGVLNDEAEVPYGTRQLPFRACRLSRHLKDYEI